jgi:RNA polymerase sigma-70 factor (ECF subfamily)
MSKNIRLKAKISNTLKLEQLIAACEKNNNLHQELLYKHFYNYALTICRLYTYNDHDAVSIMNDSFLKVFEALKKKKYNQNIPFKNWLRKIITNTAIDAIRKNLKHTRHVEINEEIINIGENSNIIETLSYHDILNFLDQLSPQHRAVFNLHEIQGYKHEEIAERLKIAISTSRVFLTRAKRELRTLILRNEP